uniref:Small ribosomal subunit protein uS14c n=1 Tax=Undaria pinnatifida TaxID=74381 RepID=A0A0R6M4Q0_UNDPI|nr:30S ribosomal protein S14 [Undaria pinnatifida]YP_011002494.1 30S ribosomal protein S14 [Undaria peterseniana]AKG49962.1 30S ribosomal protein S14 [Undaria pinnatifida]AMM05489.1 ribosomal protein S14 [Undaria pinnatifida]UXC96995.1 30S ribosomal protein S14 [Undaria pinnatifida]UXC97133.1 30S ribosomal protein S14 [Undaria pinnatifida]UXC97271.1 30S ribosomal protein S14 [Undaria pinnatifida]
MAKQSMIEREKKRERLVIKYREKRKSLLLEFKKANTFSDQMEVHKKIEKLPRNSSRIRLRNRCWRTGRSRGVYRDFGLCRHMVREMGHNCLLPGVRKASW